MKIIAMMPLYKFMDAPCVQALITMMSDIYLKGDHFKIVFTQGENICLARNQMFQYCSTLNDIDYFLCLDSDHEYSSGALYTLINKMNVFELPALSASYYMRGNRKFSMIRKNEHGIYENVTHETLGKGVQECDVFGFGFLVLKPQTIKTLVQKHKNPFVMDGKSYTGEDYYFCNLMKQEGMRVCYDADTIVGHYTSFFNK